MRCTFTHLFETVKADLASGILVSEISKTRKIPRRTITAWRRKLRVDWKWCPVKLENLVGQKFGKLTVISFCNILPRVGYNWKCQCDCGNFRDATTTILKRHKNTISCGCAVYRSGSKHCNWTGYEEISGRYWSGIRINALSRSLSFKITAKEAWELFETQEKKCAISGVEIHFGKDSTASLDRVDSKKGYELSNVQWVHKIVNRLKWNLPEGEFLIWIKKIAEHRKLK